MKIRRIDNQGACESREYDSLEELREDLCSFHSVDWYGERDDVTKKDIYSLTLEEILDYGDWKYEIIS